LNDGVENRFVSVWRVHAIGIMFYRSVRIFPLDSDTAARFLFFFFRQFGRSGRVEAFPATEQAES
jgi:hypothetical protein